MLQNTFSAQDPRLYCVARDAAHNFKHVCTVVFEKLQNRRWPVVDEILEQGGVTDVQLGQAVEAFIKFVSTANKVPKTTMDDMLKLSGWMDCHPLARVAVMAHVGAVQAGIYFKGARDAGLKSFTDPCHFEMDAFMEAGRKAAELLAGSKPSDADPKPTDATTPTQSG